MLWFLREEATARLVDAALTGAPVRHVTRPGLEHCVKVPLVCRILYVRVFACLLVFV